MIDKNGDAILEASDLVALYSEDLGKPADEAALGAMIAEAPGPLDFQMLLQLFGEKMSGTGPRPSPVLYIHSLILESSELIYVKLQNVLMTPYDIETICGGLFDLKGKSSTGYESVHFSILSVIVHFCHWN